MKDFFAELFNYNSHCNDAVISHILRHQNQVPEKSIKLINHVLNAQQIWNARILNETANCAVWEIMELQQLTKINSDNHHTSLLILENQDLQKNITYKTSKGVDFTNSVKDVLFHIINHSTYHRAQIASDLKSAGIEPLNSDYIFYKRA